jgi:hypothetical protein
MPYQITEKDLAERDASSPFAAERDLFCAKWLEKNCISDDLEYMKMVQASLWGVGLEYSETEFLTVKLGRRPSRAEVEREIARTMRIMEACYAAMTQTREYQAAKHEHDATS